MERIKDNSNSHTFLVGMQKGIATPQNNLAVSYKIKPVSTICLCNKLLGVYPRKMKTYVYTKICMHMFIGALFIFSHTGNPYVHQLVQKKISGIPIQ